MQAQRLKFRPSTLLMWMGRNIGAELMTDQAEAEKGLLRPELKSVVQVAVAKEQEMKAYTQEMV